ncbi:MAG: heparinase II/III domain-containing protein [Trebonia sp.]
MVKILLSTTGHDQLPEIWCRCDGGPHGALRAVTRAATAALSVEVRYGGVRILADPGTYCYYGSQPWRSYFRSMIAYRAPEAVALGQAFDKGRFLRFRKAHAWETGLIDHGDVANWAAEHDGYLWIDAPMRHRRSVLLDRASRMVDIIDQIDGASRDFCSVFRFGPDIQIELAEFNAFLSWPGSATPGAARMELPLGLSWSLHRVENDSAPGQSGKGIAAFMLLGSGRCVAGIPLVTRLEFSDTEMLPEISFFRAVS